MTNYPASLELYKIYRVIPDENVGAEGDIRIIDESGEDYLYPASYFASIKVPQVVKELLLQAFWIIPMAVCRGVSILQFNTFLQTELEFSFSRWTYPF